MVEKILTVLGLDAEYTFLAAIIASIFLVFVAETFLGFFRSLWPVPRR